MFSLDQALSDGFRELMSEIATVSTTHKDYLIQSVSSFQGSVSLFLGTLHSCEESPTDPLHAVCNVLTHLFHVSSEQQAIEAAEPLLFDTTALLLRECDAFVAQAKKFCDEASTSINVAAQLTSISVPPSLAAPTARSHESSRTNNMIDVNSRFQLLKQQLGIFLSESVRQHRNRVVAAAEIEKRLSFCSEHWLELDASQRQQIGESVAAEVQCRLERRWFRHFLDTLSCCRQLPVEGREQILQEFEYGWTKEWNKRREMTQDHLMLTVDRVIEIARESFQLFATPQMTDFTDMLIIQKSGRHEVPDSFTTSCDRFSQLLKREVSSRDDVNKPSDIKRPGSTSSLSNQREAIRRPRTTMSKVLEKFDPPSLLNVVDLNDSPFNNCASATVVNHTLKKLSACSVPKSTISKKSPTLPSFQLDCLDIRKLR